MVDVDILDVKARFWKLMADEAEADLKKARATIKKLRAQLREAKGAPKLKTKGGK